MEHEIVDHGLITILRLRGDLPFEKLTELGDLLHRVVHDIGGELVVDLSQVGHADPAAAGQFVAAKREADVMRKMFVLSNLSPSVKKVLHRAHADNQVPLYDTAEEAIADLAEKARGGEPRKIVPFIKCEHEDCIFYTYAKVQGVVAPACEYAYPEEISNSPSCRCYRVNWKQTQTSVSEMDMSFPRLDKQGALYAARDNYRKTHPDELEPQVRSHEPPPEEHPEPQPDPQPVSQVSVSPQNQVVPEQPVADRTIEPDPFADDNFPSVTIPHTGASETTGGEPPPVSPTLPLIESEEEETVSEPEEVIPSPPPPVGDSVPPGVPAPEPPGSSSPQEVGIPHTPQEEQSLSPAEVVRIFVESWNEDRFDKEYECLSKAGRGISKEEYFTRRRILKNDQVEKYKRATRQGISSVDSTSIEGDRAHVEVTRLDRTPRGTLCYTQYFSLVLEDGEWKIHHVANGDRKKNPTVPPKNRKMKADDFLGKSSKIKPHTHRTIL